MREDASDDRERNEGDQQTEERPHSFRPFHVARSFSALRRLDGYGRSVPTGIRSPERIGTSYSTTVRPFLSASA